MMEHNAIFFKEFYHNCPFFFQSRSRGQPPPPSISRRGKSSYFVGSPLAVPQSAELGPLGATC